MTRSCTRKGSWPLKRDPGGTVALITWSSMMTGGVTLPRNRRFPFLAGLGGSVAWSMPLGLMAGRPFRPFRRAISSRSSLTICFRAAISPDSSTSRASSSGRLSSERDGGGGTSVKNPTESSRGKRKMQAHPHFCPCYAFPPEEARRLVERFEWHYTPKHGSWLDMAESELSVLSSQCLDRRISDKQT